MSFIMMAGMLRKKKVHGLCDMAENGNLGFREIKVLERSLDAAKKVKRNFYDHARENARKGGIF